MSGRLANSYGCLLVDLWQGKADQVVPYDLKKALGTKVQRFAGTNQQDSAEFVNYLLDIIHEDLNRVQKKPYIEMSEE